MRENVKYPIIVQIFAKNEGHMAMVKSLPFLLQNEGCPSKEGQLASMSMSWGIHQMSKNILYINFNFRG